VILPWLRRRSPLGMPTFTRGLIRGGTTPSESVYGFNPKGCT
jgi:hypothetical protein